MNAAPSPYQSKPTVEDILRLHDRAFVVKAYAAILGRSPDPGGLANYLAQVRAGTHKGQILAELALSPEGKRQSVQLPGLPGVIRRYRRRVPSLWHRLLRLGSRGDSESTGRHLRAIENQLYLLDQQVQEQVKHLSDLLTLVLSSITASEPRSSHSGQAGEAGGDVSAAQTSANVARTFAELKAAIAQARHEDS